MDKKNVLVTGSSRGIGREICKQMILLEWQVIVTSRKLKDAETLAHELGHGAFAVQLDVADEESVKAAAATVSKKFGKLDVLINNAGIIGNAAMRTFDLEEMDDTLNTNLIGPIRTTKYFEPLLNKSTDARIINLSSSMGQLESLRSGGYGAYRLSKNALNAVTIMLAAEFQQSVKVFSMDPGWVQTDMGGKGAPRPLAKGAETAVWLATAAAAETGKFYRDKKVIDW